MKNTYLLLTFFSSFLYSLDLNEIKVFDETSFNIVESEINAFAEPKDPPVRGQWMKKEEYELLLKEFYENKENDTLTFAIPVELDVCAYWDESAQYALTKGIVGDPLHPSCYDVDDEVIYLNKPNTLQSNVIDLNKSFLINETTKVENREIKDGSVYRNIDVNMTLSTFNNLVVNNIDTSFHTIPIDFDFETVRNSFDAFNLFALIKIKLSYANMSSDTQIVQYPTAQFPFEDVIQENILTADFHGYILTFAGNLITTIIQSEVDNEIVVKKVELNDIPPTPVVKAPAVYPRRAQERGIMGFAIVEFDINEIGYVDNIISSKSYCTSKNPNDPEAIFKECGFFNSSAERAAIDLQFKPKIVDGKPVRVKGAEFQFTYVLDED